MLLRVVDTTGATFDLSDPEPVATRWGPAFLADFVQRREQCGAGLFRISDMASWEFVPEQLELTQEVA